MSVILGNASIDERGQISGGQPGDQTGREVWIRPWYANGWTQVCRPIDPDLAEMIAANMEAACANDNIGYDQSKRTTLYYELKKNGFDFSKVGPCSTDCSQLAADCIIGAGVSVPATMYTGNMVSCIQKTGKFEILTGREYLDEDRLLKRGDILVKQYHHTAIVLSDGEDAMPEDPEEEDVCYIDTDELNMRSSAGMDGKVIAKLPFQSKVDVGVIDGAWAYVTVSGYVAAQYLSKKKPKTTYTTTDNLNLRAEPSTSGKLLLTMPKGAKVQATGNTEKADGILWRQVIYSGRSGWASGDYLR